MAKFDFARAKKVLLLKEKPNIIFLTDDQRYNALGVWVMKNTNTPYR